MHKVVKEGYTEMKTPEVREMEQEKESVRLRDKNRITLPSHLVETLHLEKGAQMEVHIEDGRIVLVPVITIARDQAWFWTEEWQKGEREADADIAAGRVSGPFDNTDDLIRSLNADEEEKKGEVLLYQSIQAKV